MKIIVGNEIDNKSWAMSQMAAFAITWVDFENIMPSKKVRHKILRTIGFYTQWNITLKTTNEQKR